jgi:hypothetical protein
MTLLESAVEARTGQSQWVFRVEDLVKVYGPNSVDDGVTLEVRLVAAWVVGRRR